MEDFNDLEDAVELKNVKPVLISILHGDVKPSNRQGVIFKSAKGDVIIEAKITKFDEIKGLLYCEPMIALLKDTDREFYSNETVEASAHWFAKNVGLGNAADTNHNFELEENVNVVETTVDKTEDAYVWRVCYEIKDNEELMELAKAGKITGVSIAGTAEKSESNMFNKLLKALKEHFEPKTVISDTTEIIKEEEDMTMDISEILKAVEEKLPEMLEVLEKAKVESEEVKKEEELKVEKAEVELKEKEALNDKIEELEKANKDLSGKLEKAESSIKDLEQQALESSQGVAKQKESAPKGEYDFLDA